MEKRFRVTFPIHGCAEITAEVTAKTPRQAIDQASGFMAAMGLDFNCYSEPYAIEIVNYASGESSDAA